MVDSAAASAAADAVADAAADALLSRLHETLVGADDTLVAILRRLKATILAPTPSGGALLLHGPPGCGKTALARALDASSVNCVWLGLPHAAGDRIGAAESAAHAQLEAARAAAPCVLLVDEAVAVAPAAARAGSAEHRVALQLAEGFETLRGAGVFVLALCRDAAAVHPAVRRDGALDAALAMRAPSPADRYAILRKHSAALRPADDAPGGAAALRLLRRLADDAHGLCGAHLAGVCRQAAQAAIVREKPHLLTRRAGDGDDDGSDDIGPVCLPTAAEWRTALLETREAMLGPLGMCVVQPDVDLAADDGDDADPRAAADTLLDELPSGDELFRVAVLPLRAPAVWADRVRVPPPRGVLIHGPPGCGKTSLARAVAAATQANFVELVGGSLISPVVGESERNLAALFAAARAAAPSVLFVDDVESIGGPRGHDTTTEGTMDRLLTCLLLEIDRARREEEEQGSPPVLFLAATTTPDRLDPALLRAGRIDVRVAVGAPSAAQRERLLRRRLARTPLAADVSIAKLAERTAGLTLAELGAICREAPMAALREDIASKEVPWRHFEAVLPAAPIAGSEGFAFTFGQKLEIK